MRCFVAHRLKPVGTCTLLLGFLAACSSTPRSSAPITVLDATLWMQQSAEYQAITQQTYRLARDRLDQALADPTWTAALEQTGDYAELPPAVVLDVRETILETTTYSARLIRDNALHTDELWTQWAKEIGSTPVPGAVEFCTYAREKGVTVFYVTNDQEDLQEAIRHDLREAGFPLDDKRETILPGMEGGDKGPRRAAIAKEFRVLLLIGDNANDFASDFFGPTTAERADLASKYTSYWGTKWIVLPNPMYGSWEAAVFDYHFPDDQEERLRRKIQALRFE